MSSAAIPMKATRNVELLMCQSVGSLSRERGWIASRSTISRVSDLATRRRDTVMREV